MVSIGFLAQASMSRLGEINRGSPKLLHASSHLGDPRSFWASEHVAQARGVSPNRDPHVRVLFPLFEPSLRWRGLTWARPFRLSEELGEGSVVFGCFLFLDGWHLLGYNCYDKNMWWTVMYEWCDSWMVNDGFCMNLACKLNEMVGIKEAWHWYEIQRMSWYGFNIWIWMRIG